MNYTRYRWCVVSSCKNTSVKTPEKLFIQVPNDLKMRNVWLQFAKRDPMSLSTKSRLYMCENHFNLEQDMENFMEYKIMGSVKHVKMKGNITPSRLCFHSERKRKLSPSPSQATVSKIHKVDFVQRAEKNMLIEDYMEPTASSSKSGLEPLKMDRVISSNITRSFNKKNDELYELLRVVPANPIEENSVKSNICEFQPRNDKQYVPKKKIRHKVKTVRDIRNLYEKDILSTLPAELEKQQNYILRKIKGGFLKEQKTKSLAKSLLNSDKPLTKSTWQMLMNINPEGHAQSTQYVLSNGKPIRVNGSKGGKSKFICKYDLERNKPSKNVNVFKKKFSCKKKESLLNSVSVDFKPGPLTRKEFLDNSYQKYHVGQIEVAKLPKPGLEIQPLYGSALDPTISSFVNKLRDENGTITQKWAEFAVSVLGTANVPDIKQMDRTSSVTFDLNYKHDQKRLLMRRYYENECDTNKVEGKRKLPDNQELNESDVLPAVKVMMENLLDAVEININQDEMFKEDDEVREESQIDQPPINSKDRLKRRYCELDRLAVTVIRLDEDDMNTGDTKTCKHSFCALGCICNSLQSSVILKGHCGRIDCMFECKCEFSKHAMVDAMESDCPELLPGLLNLNKEINCTLSKEEQKFHQTVIVSGDKSILLKSKKRNCKSSKKYEDYYSSLCVKPRSTVKPMLTIIVPKLNCQNIEPWCMVHSLYKCFCKGRFTEIAIDNTLHDVNKKIVEASTTDALDETEYHKEKNSESDDYVQYSYQMRKRKERNNVKVEEIDDGSSSICARVNPYLGRKFSDGYYINANIKIQEMEMNDSKLRKRLQILAFGSIISEHNISNVDNNGSNIECNTSNIKCNTNKTDHNIDNVEDLNTAHKAKNVEETSNTSISSSAHKRVTRTSKITMVDESCPEKSISNKPKLVAWLESSYQQYKRRLDMGHFKTTLEPPKKGKIALYPWDFILNRYSEMKNLFLVSREAPYRIFMAVNAHNPLFENCINIDDIRFADLNKYPTTVKNLLTNTNNMKDYFCILYGYNHCWEFIGTVTKVSDQKDSDIDDETTKEEDKPIPDTSSNVVVGLDMKTPMTVSNLIPQSSPIHDNTPIQSKWFIMTIENDFSEIQFYNRGFFVKYNSIVKAINVARVSGKTVRLSSQKCADIKPDETQFGIYAIPNTNEYCVFIGPYEINESLGIETVKTMSNVGKSKRTRGVWITTDKVDNLKVIDNPLSFIPTQQLEYKDLLAIENTDVESFNTSHDRDKAKNNLAKGATKSVKPIRISKSNGFFHLSSNSGSLRNVSIIKSPIKQPPHLVIAPSPAARKLTKTSTTTGISPLNNDALKAVVTPVIFTDTETPFAATSAVPVTCTATVNRVQNRPVAEVAPQIKIAAVYSESEKEKPVQRERKGMFILKPEEINQRLVIDGNKSPKAGTSASVCNDELEMDIEHFLDNSTACPAPENEAFVISDEEDAPDEEDDVQEIYIECENVNSIGALKGEMHATKGVRFEFPGFKISEYYKPDEVFEKINQVLSRRVYIPKDLVLTWNIVDSFSKLETQRLMKKESFGPNLIMTKNGIQKKSCIKGLSQYKNVKTYMKRNKNAIGNEPESDTATSDQVSESALEFQKESSSLEEKSVELFSEAITHKDSIMKTIREACDIKQETLTDVLNDIHILSKIEK